MARTLTIDDVVGHNARYHVVATLVTLSQPLVNKDPAPEVFTKLVLDVAR